MRHLLAAIAWSGRIALPAGLLLILPRPVSIAVVPQYDQSVRSQHIRIKIPLERAWVGRDSILELEQCWQYVNRTTGEKLPRVVLVNVDWTERDNSVNVQESSISIGMSHPAAAANPRAYLIHNAARELTRLGLAELSRIATLREENQFLVEAMSEILAREYDLSAKGLTAAWVVAHFLDRIKPLSLDALSSWSEPSCGRRELSCAGPGITFLMACREQFGRDRLIKLFEALKKGSLKEALTSTFRSSAAVLEDTWLRKIRAFNAAGDFVARSDDEAPQLRKTVLIPPAGRRGASFQMRLFFQVGKDNLYPGSVFFEEAGSKIVIRGRESAEKGEKFTLVDVPVDEMRQPGSYGYRITAIDESGNVRNWEGSYVVEP